jgi:hypothetical protein
VWKWLTVAGLVLAAMLGTSRAAMAQAWGMSQLMNPPVTTDDVEELVEVMGADEAQEEIIRDLFQGMMQKHTAASEKLREILEAVSQEAQSDPTVWQDFQRKAIEYMKYQQGLKDSLFDDIKLVLTPEQSEKWPAFERFHRRQHLLDDNQTIVTPARVDLVSVMRDATEEAGDSSGASAEMADVAERYEIELDRLLIEKKEMSDRQLQEVLEVLEEGGNMMAQMPRWEKMFNENRALQVQLRDVNEKYVRLFAARMAPEAQAEFRKEYNQRAMPVVYERTYMDDAFSTAGGLESLTPEQREKITAMEQEYEREAEAIRSKWSEALAQWQTDVQMMQMWGGSKSGGPEATAQRDAKKDLDERYYDRLRTILSEDQRASLPEREKDWRSTGGFGVGE